MLQLANLLQKKERRSFSVLGVAFAFALPFSGYERRSRSRSAEKNGVPNARSFERRSPIVWTIDNSFFFNKIKEIIKVS